MKMTIHELHARAVDAPLTGGRNLRVTINHDENGSPDQLLIAIGWCDPWVRCEELRLPHEAAALLRDALASLLESEA